jgi:hypothetical protein
MARFEPATIAIKKRRFALYAVKNQRLAIRKGGPGSLGESTS